MKHNELVGTILIFTVPPTMFAYIVSGTEFLAAAFTAMAAIIFSTASMSKKSFVSMIISIMMLSAVAYAVNGFGYTIPAIGFALTIALPILIRYTKGMTFLYSIVGASIFIISAIFSSGAYSIITILIGIAFGLIAGMDD